MKEHTPIEHFTNAEQVLALLDDITQRVQEMPVAGTITVQGGKPGRTERVEVVSKVEVTSLLNLYRVRIEEQRQRETT